jgi:hypothetical protein
MRVNFVTKRFIGITNLLPKGFREPSLEMINEVMGSDRILSDTKRSTSTGKSNA